MRKFGMLAALALNAAMDQVAADRAAQPTPSGYFVER
jgi:hypothetical protein